MNITKKHFGRTPDGAEVYLYTLTSDLGLEVSIINYGGAITSLKVPDRHGVLGDIVLGYETLTLLITRISHLPCCVQVKNTNKAPYISFQLTND